MYDFVIAGGGLGGLICGYILSKEGFSVCILEKHHQIGGCLQTFKRDGCVFDTGMHYVGSLDEGQILWRFFKYYDLLDKVKLKKLDEDAFDIVSIAGEEFKYAQGHERFTETITEYFPNEKIAIREYVSKLKEIRASLENFTNTAISSNLKYFSINTYDYISSLTKNNKLQNVLTGLNALYSGKPEHNPLYVHSIINNSFIESAWRFVDGGDQLSNYLEKSILSNGGVVRRKSEVKKFVMNNSDEQVECVELINGEKIFAKKFISDIHPAVTLDMIESKKIRKTYYERIKSLENTTSIFSLYIVLKENSLKYFNNNFYNYVEHDTWGIRIYDKEKWPAGYMIYTPASTGSETYADCMIAMTYMAFDELEKWENTTIEKRGDEYLEFKNKKAEQLLDLIEKKIPDIRSHVKTYYTSTPLTYRDYTGTVNGSIYGVIKDSNSSLKSFIQPRTKISNLFFAGQNTNLHGVLGVSMGAFMTCAEFLGLDYLFGKIKL